MKTFAENLALAHYDAAHHGIGAGQASTFARQCQRVLHEANGVCVHGSVKEGICVRLGVERNHIVDLLSSADETNGQAQLARNGDDDAAFRGAVKLGEDDAGNIDGGSEFASLRKTVLTGGGVENQQDIMGRAGNYFGGGALHFFKLGHQVGFRVQASSGIYNDDVCRARLGRGRRISAGFLFDDLNAVALRPDFQLLDRGSAKRVCGAEHHTAAFLAQPVREFSDTCGLARAVDPDNKNHVRAAAILRGGNAAPGRHIRPDGRVQYANDVRLDFVLQLRGIGERVAVHLFAHGIQNLARRLDAQVGGEKRGLQILEDRRIDLPLAEKNIIDSFRESSFRLANGSFEAFRESWFGFAEESNHKIARCEPRAIQNCSRSCLTQAAEALDSAGLLRRLFGEKADLFYSHQPDLIQNRSSIAILARASTLR